MTTRIYRSLSIAALGLALAAPAAAHAETPPSPSASDPEKQLNAPQRMICENGCALRITLKPHSTVIRRSKTIPAKAGVLIETFVNGRRARDSGTGVSGLTEMNAGWGVVNYARAFRKRHPVVFRVANFNDHAVRVLIRYRTVRDDSASENRPTNPEAPETPEAPLPVCTPEVPDGVPCTDPPVPICESPLDERECDPPPGGFPEPSSVARGR